MPLSRLLIGGVLLVVAAVTSSASAETPAPPDWRDGHSVYLATNEAPPNQPTATPATTAAANIDQVAEPTLLSTPQNLARRDEAIVPAAHELQVPSSTPPTPTTLDQPARRLAPRNKTIDYAAATSNGRQRRLVDFGVPTDSIYTIVTALVIVIGTFLLFAWVMRRGARKASTVLPSEVVSVLGRVPLAPRQHAELLRVGNKLVLVSLTQGGAEPITEVTDPVEVDRLVGLCKEHDPRSTTKAFETVFRQLSNEPTYGNFGGDDSLPSHLSPAAGAYRAQRGDKTRA